jgi:hypothetical protein
VPPSIPVYKDCFTLYHHCHTLGLDLPHRLFPCDIHHCLHCTLFVIRADLLYSLLTSGLPHHVHVAHYGRPTVTPNPPRITVSGSVPPDGVARFNLSRAQATVLATRLVDSLEQNHQDATEVPPVYNYGEEFARIVAEGLGIAPDVAAEGLGIRNRRGRRGGQGRGV